jgi:hypothetical protein
LICIPLDVDGSITVSAVQKNSIYGRNVNVSRFFSSFSILFSLYTPYKHL